MIDLTAQEQRVFASMAQTEEGPVIAHYLDRVLQAEIDALVDGNPTPEQIAGVKLARKTIQSLKARFTTRGTMTVEPEKFS